MGFFNNITNGIRETVSSLYSGFKWAAHKAFGAYNDYQNAHPAAKAYAYNAAKERFKEAAEIGAVGAGVAAVVATVPEVGVPALAATAITMLEEKGNRDMVKKAFLFPAKCLHDKKNYEFLAGVPTKDSGLKHKNVKVDDLDFVLLSPKP